MSQSMVAACAVIVLASAMARGDLASLVERIKAVGPKGDGNAEASRASRELAELGPGSLVPLLNAMNGADPVALNWLRAAVDTIAERSIAAKGRLPADKLEQFVLDQSHDGRVRRLAYEWLVRVDPSAPARLIPGMLNDPALELRRDAVQLAVADAQKLIEADDKPAAQAAFQKAFQSARDTDQVLDIAKRLETIGQKPDVTRHFGCIQQWHLVGPFDNTEKAGFARSYPPESSIDLKAEYEGKSSGSSDAPALRWIEHKTADPFGIVDLNKVIGKHMGAAAYAVAQIASDKQQPVRIHIGSYNAIKLWLNGKLLYARDEYHHGMSMDQYQATGELRPGVNTILLKVCQNEQKDEWAQNWTFQLRVCDPTGAGIK